MQAGPAERARRLDVRGVPPWLRSRWVAVHVAITLLAGATGAVLAWTRTLPRLQPLITVIVVLSLLLAGMRWRRGGPPA